MCSGKGRESKPQTGNGSKVDQRTKVEPRESRNFSPDRARDLGETTSGVFPPKKRISLTGRLAKKQGTDPAMLVSLPSPLSPPTPFLHQIQFRAGKKENERYYFSRFFLFPLFPPQPNSERRMQSCQLSRAVGMSCQLVHGRKGGKRVKNGATGRSIHRSNRLVWHTKCLPPLRSPYLRAHHNKTSFSIWMVRVN